MSTYNQTILKRDANGHTIQDSYGDMAFQGEYSGGNLIYRGFARPGTATSVAKWQIAKLAYSGSSITSITWPQDSASHASSEFNFEWDERANYTYS